MGTKEALKKRGLEVYKMVENIPAGLEDHLYEEWRDEMRFLKNRDLQWSCWTLRQEDIDQVASRLGINPAELSEEEYEEIARYFMYGFRCLADNWDKILEDAVEMVL